MKKAGISVNTQVCGIIGNPLEHTLSPLIHNAAFRKLGIDFIYLPFNVKEADLGRALDAMRALNLRGMNVTLPYKVRVIEYLDQLDPLARQIGAVNLIINQDGRLKGYNTDTSAFIKVLIRKKIKLKDINAVVIGAGGASRAVCFALAEKGANLSILNRTQPGAQQCAEWLVSIFKTSVKGLALTSANLLPVLKNADLLVNTTSVGMSPFKEEIPVPADMLHGQLIVYDLVYNPVRTRLLREAESRGAITISGLKMLVYQAASAFELWTGLKAPAALMQKKALESLQQYEN